MMTINNMTFDELKSCRVLRVFQAGAGAGATLDCDAKYFDCDTWEYLSQEEVEKRLRIHQRLQDTGFERVVGI